MEILVCNTFCQQKEKLKTSAQLSTQESGKGARSTHLKEQNKETLH